MRKLIVIDPHVRCGFYASTLRYKKQGVIISLDCNNRSVWIKDNNEPLIFIKNKPTVLNAGHINGHNMLPRSMLKIR